MTPHDWFTNRVTPFAMRSLDPEEEKAFRDHLAGCDDCQAALEVVEQDLAWLSMGVWPPNPRPALAHALAERALGQRSVVPRWASPAAVAGSVLVAVVALGWTIVSSRRLENRIEEERAELLNQVANARDTLDIIRAATRVRYAPIAMGPQQGGLIVFADDSTRRWNVVVFGLPAPEAGEVCQFWFVTTTGMVKGVEVKTGGPSPAFLTLPMPQAGGAVTGAALTLEPEGSTDPAPKGPELARVGI